MKPRKRETFSRQRRYQLRHVEKGLCIYCCNKIVMGKVCLVHAVQQRERQRTRLKCRHRLRSKSYRMEKENNGSATA